MVKPNRTQNRNALPLSAVVGPHCRMREVSCPEGALFTWGTPGEESATQKRAGRYPSPGPQHGRCLPACYQPCSEGSWLGWWALNSFSAVWHTVQLPPVERVPGSS